MLPTMKRTTTSDGPVFTVNRTLTGTLSEAATIVMLVVGWGLILTALICPASLSTGPEAFVFVWFFLGVFVCFWGFLLCG